MRAAYAQACAAEPAGPGGVSESSARWELGASLALGLARLIAAAQGGGHAKAAEWLWAGEKQDEGDGDGVSAEQSAANGFGGLRGLLAHGDPASKPGPDPAGLADRR